MGKLYIKKDRDVYNFPRGIGKDERKSIMRTIRRRLENDKGSTVVMYAFIEGDHPLEYSAKIFSIVIGKKIITFDNSEYKGRVLDEILNSMGDKKIYTYNANKMRHALKNMGFDQKLNFVELNVIKRISEHVDVAKNKNKTIEDFMVEYFDENSKRSEDNISKLKKRIINSKRKSLRRRLKKVEGLETIKKIEKLAKKDPFNKWSLELKKANSVTTEELEKIDKSVVIEHAAETAFLYDEFTKITKETKDYVDKQGFYEARDNAINDFVFEFERRGFEIDIEKLELAIANVEEFLDKTRRSVGIKLNVEKGFEDEKSNEKFLKKPKKEHLLILESRSSSDTLKSATRDALEHKRFRRILRELGELKSKTREGRVYIEYNVQGSVSGRITSLLDKLNTKGVVEDRTGNKVFDYREILFIDGTETFYERKPYVMSAIKLLEDAKHNASELINWVENEREFLNDWIYEGIKLNPLTPKGIELRKKLENCEKLFFHISKGKSFINLTQLSQSDGGRLYNAFWERVIPTYKTVSKRYDNKVSVEGEFLGRSGKIYAFKNTENISHSMRFAVQDLAHYQFKEKVIKLSKKIATNGGQIDFIKDNHIRVSRVDKTVEDYIIDLGFEKH